MDFILEQCDHYFLDKTWASLVPVSAFSDTLQQTARNGSSSYLPLAPETLSTWSQLVAYLPHPPLPLDGAMKSFEDASLAYAAPAISAWPRTYLPRQLISICTITLIGVHLLYFITATFSYYFIFNHEMMRHPRFLKNQVKLEILTSVKAFPGMMFLTLPWFQAEVMGYSKLYDGADTYGWTYFILSVPLYVNLSLYSRVAR